VSEKKVTAHSGAESVDYSMEKKILSIIWRDGSWMHFHGVPSEVYYGMPSGTMLQNFVDCKLKGRYLCTAEQAPPSMSVSTINRELTVWHKNVTFVYALKSEEIMKIPEDRREAWTWFKSVIIADNRKPVRVINDDEQTGEQPAT
jgi:hypothetical protein